MWVEDEAVGPEFFDGVERGLGAFVPDAAVTRFVPAGGDDHVAFWEAVVADYDRFGLGYSFDHDGVAEAELFAVDGLQEGVGGQLRHVNFQGLGVGRVVG